MPSAISIRGLSKVYDSGLAALQGLDLEIEQGDFFALLGANGAGKSTTIGILSTLINKTSGTVSVLGHDLDKDPAGLKRCLGIVPQEFNFNHFEKVLDIVVTQAGYYGIPARQAMARAEVYLRELGLWDKRYVPSRQLSGGMKRRLMIARALIHEPRVLILDEPTAGVDIELRRSLWAFLAQLNSQGLTIILTTHYLEEAEQLSKTVGIIDRGRMVECTSTESLLRRAQRETLLLELKTPVHAAPALERHRVTWVDASTLEVILDRGESLTVLLRALEAHGIEVLSVRYKTNRLERVFTEATTCPRAETAK